jgi:hypothetical protein
MKYKSENSFIQKMTSKKDEKKDELFPVTTSKWNSNIEQNIKEIGESINGCTSRRPRPQCKVTTFSCSLQFASVL